MKKIGSEYEFVSEKDTLFKKDKPDESKINNASADVPLLSVRELSKSYGSIKAVSSLSLDVSKGRVVGLLGPNGSGKSTLLKLINGVMTKDAGEILFMGRRCGVESRRSIAYLPEKNSLPLYFTVSEAIGFYEDFFVDFERERAERIIEDFSISNHHKIKVLSKGAKEKLALALTMSRRAKLYILDKPISGVDPAARDYIIDTVLKNIPEDSSVIIATHFISDIERIMDEFVFMKYGEIYAHSTPEDVRKKYGKSVDGYFREVFRC